MDQKEIDELLKKGSFDVYNQKQEEIIKNLSEKKAPETPSPPPDTGSENKAESALETEAQKKAQKGKVMGQLTRVTEESEAGTNMVMGFLENVLNTVSKQQSFIKDITDKYQESPEVINVVESIEALSYVSDNLGRIEEDIFSAMDAFQFQDIGRQKLMKVMYTLAKLNEYLNELLGGEAEKTKTFGEKIDQKTLEHDKDKVQVDHVVDSFQKEEPQEVATNDDVDSIVAGFKKEEPKTAASSDDVDSIVANFKKSQEQSTTATNDDVDSIIAEFEAQNKQT